MYFSQILSSVFPWLWNKYFSDSVFTAVWATIEPNSGIYLLLQGNYVWHDLTHSCLAIFPLLQQFLAALTCYIAHKCSKGSSPKGLPTLSLLRILCVYLNQINFTGELNFRRRHRKVWISITKEKGLKRGLRRPLRGNFRQCEYSEKLWRENQTSHEGFKLQKSQRMLDEYS